MTNDQSDADRAIELASRLLLRAAKLQTPQERRQQAELDRMINHADDKATMVEMTDQAFRTHTPARVADQLTHLLDVQGVPRFFSPVEQAMLRGFQSFGEYLPGVAVPLVKEKMRRETANVILPAERELLTEHLRNRQRQGVQMNVNLLGEALLGEAETRRRFQQCIEILRLDDVRCLSVKISTLYSQVSPLARKHTISKVSDRLESLFRTADRETDPVTGTGKFVYLDMEEYRDLYLTTDILRETLGRPGLESTRAGIAFQAYIPDSFQVMQQLIDWSSKRVQAGGSPLTIRLVKGANMEMECVEASIGGHPQAPYKTKLETDANYKSMLRLLIDAASHRCIRIGLASHNLFDVALGLIWSEQTVPAEFMQVEMLEGMANHQRRAISEQDANMLLYAPACRQEGFLNAIGYLVRRLDENTGPQNFLRHAYRLEPDSDDFRELSEAFRKSLATIESVSHEARRNRDRNDEPIQPTVANHWTELSNEPDTDWAVPANSDWAEKILNQWQDRCQEKATQVQLSIAGKPVPKETKQQRQTFDPSRPGIKVCDYQAATLEQVKTGVDAAAKDASGWSRRPLEDRHDLFRKVAQNLRVARGDLIGAMLAEGGKIVSEGDPEISEAVDFCEFYPLTVNDWDQCPSISMRPRGVVAVITPWNFPLAIPCGGIVAALAGGNRVILKPASETVLVASLLCDAFWQAGVPRDALQLIPCDDEIAEAGLVSNQMVDTVVLTGGTSTAQRMLKVRPGLHLLAETGGKNATIVTAMADRDQAIKHIIHSAFGHAGQKCSATSLLLLEQEVFDDPHFRAALADAVESIQVGSAWELATSMGPLITPPGKELTRGMKTLEDDESWLVVPEHVVGNPNLYRPGVKWNIRSGSFTHLTELFGPVLGVMPFRRLEEAIEIVRSTGYGLTSGLESLDDREIELWKQSIHAGNLYINRPTTGAIVLRQPFGGVGLSAYGPGVKAGGPHYTLALMNLSDGQSHDVDTATAEFESIPLNQFSNWITELVKFNQIDTTTASELQRVINRSRTAVAKVFSQQHDTVRVLGQDNLRRYRPVPGITLRVDRTNSLRDALVSLIAAVASGVQLVLSIDPEIEDSTRQNLEATADLVPGQIHPIEESELELAQRIRKQDVTRLRLLNRVKPNSPLAIAAAEAFATIVDEPGLTEGRIECLRYLDEQSISYDYHRYGNLGRRFHESRRAIL
jgi:RHH-type proline utilization regulon transcriptional repressor/proline dehydrogenase/delta 1-pyrroline-5-carboxylate dehydrogenase